MADLLQPPVVQTQIQQIFLGGRRGLEFAILATPELLWSLSLLLLSPFYLLVDELVTNSSVDQGRPIHRLIHAQTNRKMLWTCQLYHKSHLGSHFPLALVLILGLVPESAWFLTLWIWLQDLAPLSLPPSAARIQTALALWLFLLWADSETHSNQGILVFRVSFLCSLLEKVLCGEICQLGQKFLNLALN